MENLLDLIYRIPRSGCSLLSNKNNDRLLNLKAGGEKAHGTKESIDDNFRVNRQLFGNKHSDRSECKRKTSVINFLLNYFTFSYCKLRISEVGKGRKKGEEEARNIKKGWFSGEAFCTFQIIQIEIMNFNFNP